MGQVSSLDDKRTENRLRELAEKAVKMELEFGPDMASQWLYHETSLLYEPMTVRLALIGYLDEYRKRYGV